MASKLDKKRTKAIEQRSHMTPEEEYLTRQKLLNAQKRYMETKHEEKLQARLEIVLSNRASKRAARKRAKASGQRKRQKNVKENPQREILRVYPHNRAVYAFSRTPTAEHPMSKKEYARYTQSPHWREFVRAWHEADNILHECFVCGSPHYDLHHWTYKNVGNESTTDVVPLCREHHEAAHKSVKAKQTTLDRAHTYIKMLYKSGPL